VLRYAFELGGKMVDAMAVPSQKAAEVAYNEKEAGRSGKVEGNLFEVSEQATQALDLFWVPTLEPNSDERLRHGAEDGTRARKQGGVFCL
jgi:hypothetical protein